MAFSSTNPPYALFDNGLHGSVWCYRGSTDGSTAILWNPSSTDPANPVGYFKGAGAGGRGQGANLVGLQVGDPMLIVSSSLASVPFEITWAVCAQSTPSVSGSTLAAAAWSAQYDVSVLAGWTTVPSSIP